MASILGWIIKVYNRLGVIIDLVNQLLVAEAAERLQLRTIQHELDNINQQLVDIKKVLGFGVPVQIQVKYTINGEKITMPITITDTQAVVASPAEVDGVGNPIVNPDPTQFTYVVSDPTAFNVVTNLTADPATASDNQVIPPGGAWIQAKQEAGHLGDFQLTINDTDDGLTQTDTITVTAGKATTLGIKFGTPA